MSTASIKPLTRQTELLTLDEINSGHIAEWKELEAAPAWPNPFFAHWFVLPGLKYLDPAQEVRVCFVRQNDGKLLGLAPLIRAETYAKLPARHFGTWKHAHTYDGRPLVAKGEETAFLDRLLAWIDTRPERAAFFRFSQLPYEEEFAANFESALTAHGRQPRLQQQHQRAHLPEDATDAALTDALTGKKRKELRRQARRLAELGDVQIRHQGVTPDMARDIANQFIDLEAEGWKNQAEDGFALARDEDAARFFHSVVEGAAKANALFLSIETLDGEATAILLSLRCGGKYWAFKTAYNESLAQYSAGVRILLSATEAMLGQADFSGLDSCARSDHPVANSMWRTRLPIVQLNVPSNRLTDAALLDLAAIAERTKDGIATQVSKLKNRTPEKEEAQT